MLPELTVHQRAVWAAFAGLKDRLKTEGEFADWWGRYWPVLARSLDGWPPFCSGPCCRDGRPGPAPAAGLSVVRELPGTELLSMVPLGEWTDGGPPMLTGRYTWLEGAPVVSVVTLTYNRPDLLMDAWRSLLDQTMQGWEWLILDGSDDEVVPFNLRVVADRRVGYFRVRSRVRRDIAAMWNLGLAEARGRYITFLDDDNQKAPGFLKRTVAHLAAHPTSLGVATHWRFVQDGRETDVVPRYCEVIHPEHLEAGNMADGGAFLWRSDCLRDLGGFDPETQTNEDWDILRRAAWVSGGLHMLPAVLHYYHLHPGRRMDIKDELGHVRDVERIKAKSRGRVVADYVKARLRRGKTPAEWFGLLAGTVMRPQQDPGEAAALLRALIKVRPKRVLEVGCGSGGFGIWLTRALSPPVAVAVDLNLEPWHVEALREFGIEGLRGDSHSPALVASLGARGPYEVIFIDADHRAEGVSRDVEAYLPMLAPGGLAVLHDVSPNDDEPSSKVHEVWAALKGRYRSDEIRLVPGRHGYGYGLLWPSVTPIGSNPAQSIASANDSAVAGGRGREARR